MLGYLAARSVVRAGRGAIFTAAGQDLPVGRPALLSRDDLTPQFGFVGPGYATARILLLGINPGNGPNIRTAGDARMIPVLQRFAVNPTEENFALASQAYMNECQLWPVWKRHCSEILGAGKIAFSEVAYSNCLPWRTQSQSGFSDEVADRVAQLYVGPLIEDLKPLLIVALGKRVAPILRAAGVPLPELIVWNRSQAATASARSEQAAAAKMIFGFLSSVRGRQTGAELVAAMQASPHREADLEPERFVLPIKPAPDIE